MKKDIKRFFGFYQDIVISCTSFTRESNEPSHSLLGFGDCPRAERTEFVLMDAKENAYHMLFLGMCITLRGIYKVTSNIEAGYGRSDISLQSMSPDYISVVVEFKQGKDIDKLKEEALQQILYCKPFAAAGERRAAKLPEWGV